MWRETIADMRVDVLHAAYTKVPSTWGDHDFVPEFNRFYFIAEGRGFVRINGVDYEPAPGQLFWLPQGVRQSYGTLRGEPRFGKHWCHFRATVMDEPLFRILDVPVFADIPEPERGPLGASFERMAKMAAMSGLDAALRVRAELLSVLAAFLAHCGREPALRSARAGAVGKLNRVLQHIDAHLDQTITVEELASIAHLHPKYFIRTFKRAVGVPPIQYVNRRRMERARTLLAATELNVSEVADRFDMEVSYFSRLFKETTGFTPSQYREMTKQG